MAHPGKWISASSDEPVVEVARRSLQERLETVTHFLPLAALNWQDGIEYVHGLRVSTRRAEVTLAMYQELAPDWRVTWIKKQLQRIRAASNNARDDDVFIRRLEQDSENKAAARLAKKVREHRRSSQKAIVEVYQRLTERKPFDARIRKLVDRVRLRGRKLKDQDPTFHDWANKKFSIMLDGFDSASDCDFSDLESLHRLRIKAKKLRYGMEILYGAFPEDFRTVLYPKLEKLQEKLGLVNDHFTATNRMQFWIKEAHAEKKELKYLQEVLNTHKRLLKKSCVDFRGWWSEKREAKMFDKFRQIIDQ